MVFGKVGKAIASAFKRREKTESYITRIPSFSDLKEYYDFLEEKRAQENAQLRAEVAKYQQKEAKQKQDKTREKEEAQVKKSVLQQKTALEESKKSLRIKFKIDGVEEHPTFFLRSNKPFGQFLGAVVEETDDGYPLWYPYLKAGGQNVKFNKAAHSFEDFFASPLGIISQMQGGKVDSNFDITENGVPVIVRDTRQSFVIPEEGGNPGHSNPGKGQVKVVRLDDQERRDFENQIEELKMTINKYANAVKESQKREVHYEKLIADKEIEAETATTEKDIWAATIASNAKKEQSTLAQIAAVIGGWQDTQLKSILTAKENAALTDAFDRLKKKFEEGLYTEAQEISAAKTKQIASDAVTDAFKSLQERASATQRIAQPGAPSAPTA